MKNSSYSSNMLLEDEPFEQIEALESRGTTSLTYSVVIKGKSYFLKQLRPEFNNDWRYRGAFHKEFEIGSKLNSKHIVKYVKIDENERGVYLLTEHINGITLAQKLKEAPEYFQKSSNFEKLFLQLLQGIGDLHRMHVAYLDINLDNIMLTQVNNDVVIIDLGFSFTHSYPNTSGCTHNFAAPELLQGNFKEIDASTDIYAIGKLMQHIQHVTCAHVPPHLQHIINRCVNPKKQHRYASTEEVTKKILKKRKLKHTLLAIAFILGLLVAGYSVLKYTNSYYHIRDQLKSMLVTPDHDFSHTDGWNKSYYTILSEDSLTCINVTSDRIKNLYLKEEVEYNGKTYRVVAIGKDAYTYRNINSVYIPHGIQKIGASAFMECHNIVSVHLPESVEELGEWCFSVCTNLRNLVLSPNLRVIPRKAFSECENLKVVHIPEGVEEIELDAFGKCKRLEKVSLPSTFKILRRGVFWECSSLKEISLPTSLTSIGEYTFYYCTNLKHVYNYSPTPIEIPPIFNQSGITLHVPKGAAELYRQANNWNRATIVEME